MGARVPPARAAAAGVRARDLVESALRRVSPPALPLLESLNGLAEARLLGVAVELGVADALADGSLTARELAQRVGADHDALGRTMRFLVSRGFFRLTGDRFANNDTTSLLRRDHPESLRDWVGMVGADWHLGIWAQAGHAVRTGDSATDAATGTSFFDYVNRVNPVAGTTFNEAMAGVSLLVAKLLARAYDFSTVTRICDVGGETGALVAELASSYPTLEGTVVDLPELAARAEARFARHGLTGRCRFVGGDFFEEVPDDSDRYVLLSIIHDWDDVDAARILGTVRRALRPDARALVVERVLPAGARPEFARVSDLEMLVLTGSGRERRLDEYGALFARAGLHL